MLDLDAISRAPSVDHVLPLVAALRAAPGRTALPNRRANVSIDVLYPADNPMVYRVTFGRAVDAAGQPGPILEVFCDGPRGGSTIQAILRDGCIMISHLLQRGLSLERLAAMMCEDRGEGQASGPPSSILGAIVRAGVGL